MSEKFGRLGQGLGPNKVGLKKLKLPSL